MKIQELLLNEMAKRATADQFIAAAKKELGAEKLKAMKWSDIDAIAKKAELLIPPAIRAMKSGRGTWNLSGSSKEEPKAEVKAETKKETGGADIAEIKAMIPELDKDTHGDMLHWQVNEWKGNINVNWDYTFRRDSHVGAYRHNSARIEAANNRIKRIAEKYKSDIVEGPHYYTMDDAKRSVAHRESNGESPYSEYEQSLGGGITLKAKA